MGEEAIRRGPLPPLVRGREVRAYIPFADCSEDRIRQCVETDIGVGMAAQRPVVLDPHSIEPDMVARTEGVDVEPSSGADVAETGERREKVLPGLEIAGTGQFHVGILA